MFDEITIQNLKYYVYLLIDPVTDEPFYVGKGKGNRVFAHVNCALEVETENEKYNEIRRIVNSGDEVKHVIVRHGLKEKEAFMLEAALIDTFKFIPQFNNFVRGNIQGGINSIEKGLMSANDIIRLYNAEELDEIGADCVIININRNYKRGSGDDAIYNATKGTWRMRAGRLTAIKYVLSEYRGLIVEVFKVDEWFKQERPYGKQSKRYGQTYLGFGFKGSVAADDIRNLYINKSIAHKKKRGSANVIRYNL